MDEQKKSEEFRISGDEVIGKIKELISEGNVRRIILKDEKGVTLFEIPLSVGVIGVLLLPVWAAIGAVAAMVAKFTLVVERRDTTESEENEQK